MENVKVQKYLQDIKTDLDKSVKFWLEHSHDDDNGGFFNCLGEKGTKLDSDKYGWLQGRQVWTYCRLYNEVERFHKEDILTAAIKGADFMMKHLKDRDTCRCYFQVTADGRPIKIQRTIFTECFYVMAMSELAKASKQDIYKKEAEEMMEKIVTWVKTGELPLGRPKLAGATRVSSLGIPMTLLCLIDQMSEMDDDIALKYKDFADELIKEITSHCQRGGDVILETVSVDGKEIEGYQGRLTLPGHAIECGWFLLKVAIKRNDTTLKRLAIDKFILNPLDYGWDERYGGLFYFLDADGHPPLQLEWNMKLWWPHCEAMIALLMAFEETKDPKIIEKFDQVFNYSYTHFVDKTNGEWFGYLNQKGELNSSLKGAPFKGCFHVIRCLMVCEQILQKLADNQET